MQSSAPVSPYLLIKYPLCKQAVAPNEKTFRDCGGAVLIAITSWTIKWRESGCKKVSRNYNPDPLLSKVSFPADRLREDCLTS
jgi:hypothetical protein